MNPVATAISQSTLGIDVTCHNLTMFPLLSAEAQDPTEPEEPFLTLDDALASGWAHITELTEEGHVPELRFVNGAPRPVFVLDGEELVGAKQNRVVNLSILAPAQSSLTIPVSCVESGRWHARSRSFTAAPRAQYAAGRARKMRQVTESMLCCGAYRSNQSAVWQDIEEKAERMGTRSETSAMSAMFADHTDSIESFVAALTAVPRQVGALFAIGSRVIGLDLFQTATLLRKQLPKVVRSYALDAIDPANAAPGRTRRPNRSKRSSPSNLGLRAAAVSLLSSVMDADGKSMPALGLGTDVRIDARHCAAAVLVYDDRVVHLSAFANA